MTGNVSMSLIRASWIPRGAAFGVALTVASGLAIFGRAAGAAPRPTIGQAQAQVNSLQAKVDRIGQQYDQVSQELVAAQGRLARVNGAAASENARYLHARAEFAQVAIAA